MSQIKQLLQLHQQGKGIKFIARSLAISKNTVKAYLARTAALPESIPVLLALEDPVLEARYHAGNPAYKDERFEYLKSRFEYYTAELKQKGVNRKLLWEEYRQQQPQGYSYTQFCFQLSQHLLARKPSMVLQHQPAEKLFIDFAGKKLSDGWLLHQQRTPVLAPPALPGAQPGVLPGESKSQVRTLFQLIERLFEQKRYPEQLYRTCDGLLRLQSKAAPEEFDRACRLAIECQSYSYRFVRNVLENNMASHAGEPKQDTPLPVHQNIRGRDYYAQTSLPF